MNYPRDSHAIVERQVNEDLSRNDSAFLFAYVDEDLERNERPIVLCEMCGQHTHGENDGELIVGECEHCGEGFAYSQDDARVMEVFGE